MRIAADLTSYSDHIWLQGAEKELSEVNVVVVVDVKDKHQEQLVS